MTNTLLAGTTYSGQLVRLKAWRQKKNARDLKVHQKYPSLRRHPAQPLMGHPRWTPRWTPSFRDGRSKPLDRAKPRFGRTEEGWDVQRKMSTTSELGDCVRAGPARQYLARL